MWSLSHLDLTHHLGPLVGYPGLQGWRSWGSQRDWGTGHSRLASSSCSSHLFRCGAQQSTVRPGRAWEGSDAILGKLVNCLRWPCLAPERTSLIWIAFLPVLPLSAHQVLSALADHSSSSSGNGFDISKAKPEPRHFWSLVSLKDFPSQLGRVGGATSFPKCRSS